MGGGSQTPTPSSPPGLGTCTGLRLSVALSHVGIWQRCEERRCQAGKDDGRCDGAGAPRYGVMWSRTAGRGTAHTSVSLWGGTNGPTAGAGSPEVATNSCRGCTEGNGEQRGTAGALHCIGSASAPQQLPVGRGCSAFTCTRLQWVQQQSPGGIPVMVVGWGCTAVPPLGLKLSPPGRFCRAVSLQSSLTMSYLFGEGGVGPLVLPRC